MVTIRVDSQSVELADAFAIAAQRNADRIAALVAELLEPWGTGRAASADGYEASDLQPALLLELAAVIHLREWETAGLVEFIDLGLPSVDEAIEQIATKLENGFVNFASIDSASLWHRVNAIWCGSIAWEGEAVLGAKIAISPIHEDDLLDALADFLWTNRRAHISEGHDTS